MLVNVAGCLLLFIGLIVAMSTTQLSNEDLAEHEKRREEIKRTILETLGQDERFLPKKQKNDLEEIERNRDLINTKMVKKVLLNTLKSEDVKEIILLKKNNQLRELCKSGKPDVKELILQYFLDLEIFQKNTLSNAFLYFYKKGNTPGEEIVVKEVPVVGTHEHTINKAYFTTNGWLSIDITKQVKYWSRDLGEEMRTLKLTCADNCAILPIEHCDSKAMPFLTFELTPKKHVAS